MVSSEVASQLNFEDNGSKIILFVIDGVGGLPLPEKSPLTKRGLTELETAHTPNLDKLAAKGITGMSVPVAPGVAPGSGVAHLALFGYDPLRYAIGRGAIAAYGVGLDMDKGDMAVRINFAGYSPTGAVLDRRAGRLATEKNIELCKLLREIKLPGVEIVIQTVLDYRSVAIFRGEGLHPHLSDSDPQATGENVFPHEVKALDPKGEHAGEIANAFIKAANEILREGAKGIADLPDLVGEFDALDAVFQDYDFIFFHVKKPDSAGEDGNFSEKVRILEELDELVPRLEALNPDVIVIAGDHSTPATYKAHSWHPVPFALVSEWCRPDSVKGFSESECEHGALGQFPAAEVMLYALGHARRIAKFGA